MSRHLYICRPYGGRVGGRFRRPQIQDTPNASNVKPEHIRVCSSFLRLGALGLPVYDPVRMKAFVPDTNAWLHGKLPLDFAAMAEGEPFKVVVPHKVLSELDDRQHEGRGATRKRARLMVMELRSITRGGVAMAGAIEAEAPDGVPYRLVSDAAAPPNASADDVIVATAASLRSAGLTPTVVTADAAMQMTAKLAGLEVRVLTPDELEPDDADSLEQKVASLERQLKKLQDPQALAVEVVAQPLWPRGDPPELVRLAQPSDLALDELRKQVQIGMQLPATASLPATALSRPYLEALPEYAREVMEYLRELARWEAIAEAGIEVQILVINRTPHPVVDAVLELKAPAHVMFKYPPAKPEPPATPESPEVAAVRPAFGFPGLNVTGFGPLGTGFPIPPPLSQPHYGPKVRAELRWAEMRPAEPLRPDHEAFAGRLWIGVEPEFEGEEIVIPYTLYAAVAGKPTSGAFGVPIRWREEAWQPPTLPTYDEPRLPESTRTHQRVRERRASAEN